MLSSSSSDKFRKYVIALLSILTLSLLFLTIGGFNGYKKIRHQFASLYYERLIGIDQLNKIAYTDSTRLIFALEQLNRHRSSSDVSYIHNVLTHYDAIVDKWHGYKKSSEYSEYALESEYAFDACEKAIEDISTIIEQLKERQSLSALNIYTIKSSIKRFQKHTVELIDFELKMAKFTKNEVDLAYESSVNNILFILAVTFVAIFVITLSLFRCVNRFGDFFRISQLATKSS